MCVLTEVKWFVTASIGLDTGKFYDEELDKSLSFNKMVNNSHIKHECGGGTTIDLLVSKTPSYPLLDLPTTASTAFHKVLWFQ